MQDAGKSQTPQTVISFPSEFADKMSQSKFIQE